MGLGRSDLGDPPFGPADHRNRCDLERVSTFGRAKELRHRRGQR